MSAERITLATYVAAGLVYIIAGAIFPRLILSWIEGAFFLILLVCVIPALVRRLRS